MTDFPKPLDCGLYPDAFEAITKYIATQRELIAEYGNFELNYPEITRLKNEIEAQELGLQTALYPGW